jgi:hypothetical protein
MIVNCELKDPTTALRCALSNRRNEDNIVVRYFNDNVLSDVTTFPFDFAIYCTKKPCSLAVYHLFSKFGSILKSTLKTSNRSLTDTLTKTSTYSYT